MQGQAGGGGSSRTACWVTGQVSLMRIRAGGSSKSIVNEHAEAQTKVAKSVMAVYNSSGQNMLVKVQDVSHSCEKHMEKAKTPASRRRTMEQA